MKFFTPELIAMTRSEDDATLDEAEDRWEEAGARYSEYLDGVRDRFPRGLRRLFSRYYLHDAAVHRVSQKDRFFLIELQLDTPPRSFLTFRYRLLRPVQIDKESLPPSCRAKGAAVDWLYAEVEQATAEEVLRSPQTSTWVKDEWLAAARASERDASLEWPFWVHRILLSNGWELTVHFHDVEVEEYEDLLVPMTANGRIVQSEIRSPTA
jgi:hypothetical protein